MDWCGVAIPVLLSHLEAMEELCWDSGQAARCVWTKLTLQSCRVAPIPR